MQPTSTSMRLAAGVALLVSVAPLHVAGAQLASSLRVAPTAPAAAACAGAAAARGDAAVRLTTTAEGEFRARVAAHPGDADAHVALATTLLRCRIPLVTDVPTRGELSGEAIELLERALELEPLHWTARFTLATTYARMPEFMRLLPNATRQADTLLRLQGERVEPAVLARTWELRGELWLRAKSPDSALAVWRRGAALFPTDTALARRVREAAPRDGAPTGSAAMPGNAAAPPRASAPAETRSATLGAVRVVARTTAPARLTTPGAVALGRSQLQTTPGAMADVFQNVNLLPSATRATEGSDVFTRGGDPAETPIYVDGGRLLAASRFEGLNGGLFGALDPAVLRSARFLPGGFGARFGNALSGVLDVETEGRTSTLRARAGLNTVNAAATVRAPLGTAKASAWGTVRGANTAALLHLHGRADEFTAAPWSLEAMGGVVAEPRPGTELRANALVEHDASTRDVDAGGLAGPFRSTGDTRLLVLAARTLLPGAPVLLRGNVAASDRETGFTFGVLARERRDASLVVRVDADWSAAERVTVRGGLEAAALSRTETGRVPLTPRLDADAPAATLPGRAHATEQAGGWGEVALALPASLTLEAGLRVDRLPGERATTLDPRLALAWQHGAWTARAAGGVYHQGRWRALSPVPDAGLPSRVPTRATHAIIGVERDGALRWRAEVYHKAYSRFARAAGTDVGRDATGADAGPVAIAGSADGLELLAQRVGAGRVGGWVGYSLMRARLDLADGRRVHAPTDVTHALTGVATLALPRAWSLGATARYGTGVPFTPVTGARQVPAGPDATFTLPEYGEPLGGRLPAYGRLDLRLMRGVTTRAGLLTAYVEALNVLDHANVARYTYDASYTARRPVHAFFASRTIVVGTELTLR